MNKKSQKVKTHKHSPSLKKAVHPAQHPHVHQTHDGVKKRLQRASGHLNKVIRMIECEEKCIDISMQLHAVVKALIEAKKTIIHDHLENCLNEENLSSSDLKEFKDITKYL